MDIFSKEKRSKIMSKITSKNTKPEILVRKLLYRLGFRYRLHYKGLPGKPDVVFISRKKAIFVNGCFWHGHGCRLSSHPKSNVEYWENKIARNKARDSISLEALESLGWETLTVWECETKNEDILAAILVAFMED